MKNPSKVLLATAALITLHSTAGWSEPILQITQSQGIRKEEEEEEEYYVDGLMGL